MPRAWRNFYHPMGNTFATWLPGDKRGWRSWRHREHCEGDYKRPPPAGSHDDRLRRSLKLMKRPPVLLEPAQRLIAARAMGERLSELGVELVDLCVTSMHFHMLARFAPPDLPAEALQELYARLRLVEGNMLDDGRDPLPRHVVGLAKKHASFALREAAFSTPWHRHATADDATAGHAAASRPTAGGVWAKKSHIVPIDDHDHLLKVARYIRDHVNEGGAVLSIIEPTLVIPPPSA